MASSAKPKAGADTFPCIYLPNQFSSGPEKASGHHISTFIIDPVITIERHNEKFHISARFDIETAIEGYSSQTRDGHEWYFHDICLQYWSRWDDEDLVMKPESDPAAAMTVTRTSNTALNSSAGVSLSQTPSGNVSLGLTRSRTLTVEYPLGTWSLSAHRLLDHQRPKAAAEEERPRYQWYWAGTHKESKRLSPDMKHTVKRHVVAKRIIPQDFFANRESKEEKTVQTEKAAGETGEPSASDSKTATDEPPQVTSTGSQESSYSLERLLSFHFHVQVRVKRRFGRFHRLVLLSTNDVKGKLANPTFEYDFDLKPEPYQYKEFEMPERDTPDIAASLNKLKKQYEGRWEELKDKDVYELLNASIVARRNVRIMEKMHESRRHREREAVRVVNIVRG